MADTRVQLEVEDWVRENWMREQFGQPFYRNRVQLTSGGVFDFDAVSEDKSIAACISTSAGKTGGGKFATGKLMKLRSDMLFLYLAVGLARRLLIVIDKEMHETCLKERSGGRSPKEIEFLLATIPHELHARLVKAREIASREVTPTKAKQLPDEVLLAGDGTAKA